MVKPQSFPQAQPSLRVEFIRKLQLSSNGTFEALPTLCCSWYKTLNKNIAICAKQMLSKLNRFIEFHLDKPVFNRISGTLRALLGLEHLCSPSWSCHQWGTLQLKVQRSLACCSWALPISAILCWMLAHGFIFRTIFRIAPFCGTSHWKEFSRWEGKCQTLNAYGLFWRKLEVLLFTFFGLPTFS